MNINDTIKVGDKDYTVIDLYCDAWGNPMCELKLNHTCDCIYCGKRNEYLYIAESELRNEML